MQINQEKLKKEAVKNGIKMLILFGSQASGKAKSESDFDLAILMMEGKNIQKNLAQYNKVLFFLAKELGIAEEKIDLTNLNSASPLLQKEIFVSGNLLFGDDYEFVARKAAALRQYLETRSLRELRSKRIKKRQQMLAQKIYA